MLLTFLFSHTVFATDIVETADANANIGIPVEQQDQVIELSNSQCETLAVNQDFQVKYENLKKNIESDYSTGLPNKLKIRLTTLRMEADLINQKIYDLQNNNQEINNIVANTVNKLDEFIQILPAIASSAPKIRDEYIVPFANLNSLKADEQQCIFKMRAQASQDESSVNIYQKLTQELQMMSSNLHQAGSISPQKYIIYRSELMETLSLYNKKNRLEDAQILLTTIPKVINALQREIEILLPGLQLSKNYYSISSL